MATRSAKEINIAKTHLVMLRVPSVAKDISTKIGHKHKELHYFKTVWSEYNTNQYWSQLNTIINTNIVPSVATDLSINVLSQA